MSSEPSNRTYAPTCAMRLATSGECRNIENGPCSAPRLLTMLSAAARPAGGTCSVLVISGSRAIACVLRRAGARILRPPETKTAPGRPGAVAMFLDSTASYGTRAVVPSPVAEIVNVPSAALVYVYDADQPDGVA